MTQPEIKARRLSPEGLKDLIHGRHETTYQIVDVRNPDEYRQGHIPGAVLIPVRELEQRLPELNPDVEHVFYCRSGGRSSAATLLAEESGLLRQPLYNLDGGILGWNGIFATDMPRVNVFAGVSSLRDLLQRAIDMEKAAYFLYSRVSLHASRDSVCSLMKQLVSMEESHARVVYAYLKKQWEHIPPFESFFLELRGSILEGGLSMEELEPWVRGASTGDCMEIADLALEVEAHAMDLYRTLARTAADGQMHSSQWGEGVDLSEAADLFMKLAQQEKQHIRLILEHMDAFE